MKQRPWPIVILAWLHFLAPLGNIVLNAQSFNMTIFDYLNLRFYQGNFWGGVAFILAPPLAGLAIYLCKRWSFLLYFLMMASLLSVSLYHIWTRPELKSIAVPVACLLDILLVAYFLIPQVRKIYFDPRLRWWEAKARFRADFEAIISFEDKRFTAQILNLSESGLFLKASHLPADGASVHVEFKHQDINYESEGIAIHHGKQTDLGIGVKFKHTLLTERAMKRLAHKLIEEDRLITTRMPGPEDSFKTWLRSLLKSGKGLLP